MKLYVWSGVMELANYLPGSVIAFAETLEQAIEVAVLGEFPEPSLNKYDAEMGARLRLELSLTTPDVHDTPIGFSIRGYS